MKKIMLTGLAVIWAMTGLALAQIGDVNFTLAEFYANGLLDGQEGWAAESGWNVDTSGSGSATTSLKDQRAVYGGDPIILPGGDNAIRIRADFTYNGSLAAPGINTVIGLFGVSSVAVTNWLGTDADGTFLMAKPDGDVILRYENNTLSLSPAATLTLADMVGDDLAVEYTVALGSDAASSTFQAKLINVTDATESALGSYTGLEQNVFDAATTTGLHPTLWCGEFSDNGTGITGFTVESISWETIEVLSGTTVDFVDPPYTNGQLNGQQFWAAPTGAGGFVVDTSATTVRRSSDYGAATYGGKKLFNGGASEGATATIKADFYFEGVMTDVNKTKALFQLSNYAQHQGFYLSTTGGGTLQIRNNGNGIGYGTIAIPGFDDLLRLTYTLTLGPDAATSEMTATLSNTVSGASATGSYAGIDAALYSSATTNGIYFRVANQLLDGNTAFVLDQLNLDETAAPEPLPPGTVDFVDPPYVDGQLSGQQFWTAAAGGGGFVVDTTATTVRRSNDFGAATYGGHVLLGAGAGGEGASATATADFYFEGVMTDVNLTRALFQLSNYAQHQGFYLSTPGNGTLQIRNNGNGIGYGSIPIPGADDLLRFTYTLDLGADAASSEMIATVSNTVSGASATGSYTGIDATLYSSATNSGVYFRYANQNLGGNTALVLDLLNLADEAAPEPLPPGTVDFVDPPYTTNPLNGQEFWSASAGFDVDTTATTVRKASNYGAATYGGLVLLGAGAGEGASATATADFYFEGVVSSASNPKATFAFSDYAAWQQFYIASTATGLLRLRDQNNVDIPGSGSMPIPGADDALRMTYTLTLGSNEATSAMSATLSNTVSGASMSAVYSNIQEAVYTSATTGGVYFRYGNSILDGNTALVLDQIQLQDDIPGAPSGFDTFVATYGLSGVKTDDKDGDGLNDWGEYVFDGNPDDGGIGDVGTQPSLDGFTYNYSLIGDDTIVAHVLTNGNLLTGTWGTNFTRVVTATDGVLSNYVINVEGSDQLFIKLEVEY